MRQTPKPTLKRLTLTSLLLLALAAPARAQHDLDTDGLIDDFDNCIYGPNVDQSDVDGDNTGDVCDNCAGTFNAAQSDADANGIGDACDGGTPAAFVASRVRLRAARPGGAQGTILVRGVFDTTELGGVEGLRIALQRGFALGVSGGGLSAPETIFFPPCTSVAICSATGRLPAHPVNRVIDAGSPVALAGFRRKGGTNLFTFTLTAHARSFQAPLASAGVTVTLSLGTFSFGTLYFGGLDRPTVLASCRARGRAAALLTCRP